MKRAKKGADDKMTSSWQDEISAAIRNGDADEVKDIVVRLRDLASAGKSRLDSLKAQVGTGVVLVKIEERDSDEDVLAGYLDKTSIRVVSAKFTAGPKRHIFHMRFEVVYCGDNEMYTISGPCFDFVFYGDRDATPKFCDHTIEEFFMKAGLEDARPERSSNANDMTPEEQRRWVLGDMIYDAIGLLGFPDAKCDLGMGQEDAYGWLGLELQRVCPKRLLRES